MSKPSKPKKTKVLQIPKPQKGDKRFYIRVDCMKSSEKFWYGIWFPQPLDNGFWSVRDVSVFASSREELNRLIDRGQLKVRMGKELYTITRQMVLMILDKRIPFIEVEVEKDHLSMRWWVTYFMFEGKRHYFHLRLQEDVIDVSVKPFFNSLWKTRGGLPTLYRFMGRYTRVVEVPSKNINGRKVIGRNYFNGNYQVPRSENGFPLWLSQFLKKAYPDKSLKFRKELYSRIMRLVKAYKRNENPHLIDWTDY